MATAAQGPFSQHLPQSTYMWLISLNVDLGSFQVYLEKMNICKTVVIDICVCIGTVNLVLVVILVTPTTFFLFYYYFSLIQDLV